MPAPSDVFILISKIAAGERQGGIICKKGNIMKHSNVMLAGLSALLLAACSPNTPETAPTEPVGSDEPAPPAEVTPAGPFAAAFPAWYEPAEPFRVIGNIYHVGPKGLGIFFIPTEDGHILIDGGLPENADGVLNSIRALGHDPRDVKYLLNTHAHFDHSGGLARLKAATGAALISSEGDRSALEGGFYLGFEDRPEFSAPPVKVDATLGDRGTVGVGGTVLTALLTPGHTRGCTSWRLTVEEAGTPYEVLIFCSASVAANRLAPDPQYEGIIADYESTFERARGWQPDVFLANHPEFSGLWQKRAAQLDGDALAFVDRDAFPAYMSRMEQGFREQLAKQTSEE
jgi:metallo-beta-lactamase class B